MVGNMHHAATSAMVVAPKEVLEEMDSQTANKQPKGSCSFDFTATPGHTMQHNAEI